MNDMGKEWVVLGAFKLKEWYVSTGYDEVTNLYHRPCDEAVADVDHLFFPEILDLIAAHRCPTVYGEEVSNGAEEALDKRQH